MLLSALVHGWLIARYGVFEWPSVEQATTLEARLVAAKPKKLAPPAPLPTPKPELEPETKPEPAPEQKPESAPEAEVQAEALAAPETELAETELPVEPEQVLPVTELPVEPALPVVEEVQHSMTLGEAFATTAQEQAALAASAEEAAPQRYRKVATGFNVYMNGDAQPVGEASILYTLDADNHYQLTWQVDASGLLALVYPRLLQTSVGEVTDTGLRPQQYSYQFGSKANKSYTAQFNWADKQLLLTSSKGEKQTALPDNTQDFLSFMYQFMFVPPLQTMQLSMTNGKKLASYDYTFVGEERLTLKFDTVNTYHIRHSKADSEDKTELWLALDYGYIPVKIKKTEKNGTVIEQIAITLTTEIDEPAPSPINKAVETLNQETPLP